METITPAAPTPPLHQVLAGFQFSEHHSGIVEAPPAVVWDALKRMHWTDLSATRPLLGIRRLAPGVLGDRLVETFTERAGAVLSEDPPDRLLLVMVGKPWSLVPQHAPVDSLDQVQSFTEPGWLKYGMEWALHPVEGNRTLVETRTLCESTDRSARRAFGAYWRVIRPFSGLLRWDMISTLRRLSAST
ncbi:hypothetical protein [Pseudoclavibacter helvolus]|nr:hypothetical protein [Pseudoclavibacter helvolus]